MEEEFLKYYSLYKNDVFRLAISYTKNLNDAEDITQSVFIKLFKNLNKFTSDIEIKKWCIKVTVNECKNYCLSFWRKKVIRIDDNLERNLSYKELFDDDLKDLIFALPPNDRLLIFLYYYEGYKYEEIGNLLNINSSTIQTKISRIIKKLEKNMKGVFNYER